ncbi:hypothetical protein FDECE_12654 [Fusarium decemcellulare]|nr:hypothetical protein FDECE_12654 [Fusarium decemcellulare]
MPGIDSFDPRKDIPSLEGKTILITGGTSGLGHQSALDLARHNPSAIWITGRSAEKGAQTVNSLKQISPSVSVHFLEMDLSSKRSIGRAAQSFLEAASRIDILLLNAGVMNMPPGTTKDGYETHFGTNHMGHALLIKLLTPLLLKTSELESSIDSVRIVFVSSDGHKFPPKGGIQFDNLKGDGSELSSIARYGQSKLANVLYAREIARRFPHWTTVSIHPGTVKTELHKSTAGASLIVRIFQKTVLPLVGVDVEEGVKNQLWAATASDVLNGEYYEPMGVTGRAGKLSMDLSLAKKLWEWTEKEMAVAGS